MPNIHGLFSGPKDDNSSDDERENRFVGGISARGGGSGLAVEPNPSAAPPRDSVFQLAEHSGGGDGEEPEEIQRTITMYREGFVIDDGPYRRLDDPANADFLRALAMGRTPAELVADGEGNNSNVMTTVGLVDKRNQDYVETFRSFSGAGSTLGGSNAASAAGGSSSTSTGNPSVVDPQTLPPTQPLDPSRPSTSIQVRLPNGTRQVLKINLDVPVLQLAANIAPLVAAGGGGAETTTLFQLVTGFPPKPLENLDATVEAAGLKGAQVQIKKVDG